MSVSDLLEMKGIVQRLLYQKVKLEKEGTKTKDIDSAISLLRDIIESKWNQNREIPLHWYEYDDETFLRKLESASIKFAQKPKVPKDVVRV